MPRLVAAKSCLPPSAFATLGAPSAFALSTPLLRRLYLKREAAQMSSQALRSFLTLRVIFHARLKMLIVDNAAAGHYVEAASPRSLPAGWTFPKVENTFPTELRIHQLQYFFILFFNIHPKSGAFLSGQREKVPRSREGSGPS